MSTPFPVVLAWFNYLRRGFGVSSSSRDDDAADVEAVPGGHARNPFLFRPSAPPSCSQHSPLRLGANPVSHRSVHPHRGRRQMFLPRQVASSLRAVAFRRQTALR